MNLHIDLVIPFFNNKSSCIVGIIGLYCSMVTNMLAPIVSRPAAGVNYVKLAASTSESPEHHYNPTFIDVFHAIASSK